MDKIKHLQLKHPFTCVISGPTGSGKTLLVQRILKHRKHLIHRDSHKPLKILWAYGQFQKAYLNLQCEYFEGVPKKDDLLKRKPDILVLDDLMQEIKNNPDVMNLFTTYSHHLNMSVIFIVQNLFFSSPTMRTISLNAQYMFLMKNPRDKSQISCLARQIYPGKTPYFIEAYQDATSRPFSYLKIDLTPDTPDVWRLSTRFTLEESDAFEFSPLIYFPKDV